MGRVRLNIRRLESSSNRQVTYCKRRTGILKKANDIAVLCDIEIILLMFSPTGKPTLFQGQRSTFDEIIAKFAQLTPQERAKRKLESLEALRKTFKKLGHDVGVQEFLDASDPSVEELENQVRVLRSWLTEVENRLSWWSNPDMIHKAEHLRQMECTLRESLNAVHVQKLQNTARFNPFMGSEQERRTLPWHQPNKSHHMSFHEAPNFLPQRDIGCSGGTSIATCSHDRDPGKGLELDQTGQATPAILDAGVFDDLTSISCLRQQLSEPFPYDPCDNRILLEGSLDSQSEVNLKGYLMDYEIPRNLHLPKSVDSVNNSCYCTAGAAAVTDFDEKLHRQQGNCSR